MKVRELIHLLGQCDENDNVKLELEWADGLDTEPLISLHIDRGDVVLTNARLIR